MNSKKTDLGLKALVASLGLFAANHVMDAAIQTALQESFETDGSGSRYLVENGADDGEADFFNRRQEFSNGTVASGGTIDGQWMWGARDIDNAVNATSQVQDLLAQEGRLTFSNIDITGLGNLQLEMAVAEGGEGFEPNNTMLIEVRIDGGDWTNIGGFRSRGTNAPARYFVGGATTLTGVDSPRLVPEFVDFAWPVGNSGSSLDLRVTFNSNASAEDYYVDNVRISGDDSLGFFGFQLEQETFQEPGTEPLSTSLGLQLTEAAPAGGLVVTLDQSAIAQNTVDLPETITVPAGETTLQIPFEIRQDNQFTGTKVIEIDFMAEGYSNERLSFVVENTTAKPRVVMMEILNINPGVTELDLIGDSNGDGIRNGSADDFVEIVNFEDYPVDISGWTISDDLGIRHEFAEGTVIGAGRAIVVFGGGNPTGIFGGATITKSSSGLLAFNSNRPEIASLVARLGGLVETVNLLIDGDIYPVEPNGGSIHRSTGETGAPYTIHSQIAGANSSLYSPGTLPNGQPYFTPENTLSLSLSRSSIREDETGDATIATVSLESPAPAGGLVVEIESNGFTFDEAGTLVPDEISIGSTTITIPEGQTQATFGISGYNDELLDGVRDVRIVVRSGADILPDLAILKVEDIEPNPFNVVINEVMPMILGTGADINLNGVVEEAVGDKFIEFLNLSGFVADMSGWQIRVSETSGASAPEIVHTFPEGTALGDQGALVVFGRATAETYAGRETVFGNAVIQGALNPDGSERANGLSLQRAQDTTIELLNAEGFQVAVATYEADISNQAMAITRFPDPSGDLTLHLAATGGQFIVYSPGVTHLGEAFSGSGDAVLPEPETEAVDEVEEALSAAVPAASPAEFVYVSGTGEVGNGRAMTIGFEVAATEAGDFLLRASSLESSGGVDTLITLYRQNQYGRYEVVARNDDWSEPNGDIIEPIAIESGVSIDSVSAKDAAVLVTLESGVYSAVISSRSGVGMVIGELFAIDSESSEARLANVSNLGYSAGLGFIASNGNETEFLLRAVTDGLKAWGIRDVVGSPVLSVNRQGQLIAENRGWSKAELGEVSSELGATPLVAGSADAAVFVEAVSGSFSAEVSGSGSGMVLIELFDALEPVRESAVSAATR